MSDLETTILAHMRAHRSVRQFSSVELSDADVAEACSAAQMASTSSYVQAYSLLRVRDTGKRQKLAELTGGQAQVHQAGGFFVILADVRRHHLITARAERGLARNLESFLVAVIDAALFAQNFALALEAQGHGICFIGGLRNHLDQVDALLELPADVFPLFGLCAGQASPDDEHVTRPRLPLKAMLFDDAYPSDEALLSAVDAYDQVVAAHYAERGLAGRNWTGGLIRRLETPIRKELLAYYQSKGAQFE
jgi:FMN reductase (NADPH)